MKFCEIVYLAARGRTSSAALITVHTIETWSLASINILLSKLCRRKQFNFLLSYKSGLKINVRQQFKRRCCHYELPGLYQLSYFSVLLENSVAVIMAFGRAIRPSFKTSYLYLGNRTEHFVMNIHRRINKCM
jgi:hypothetical protein